MIVVFGSLNADLVMQVAGNTVANLLLFHLLFCLQYSGFKFSGFRLQFGFP